jgi:hypothetical protein
MPAVWEKVKKMHLLKVHFQKTMIACFNLRAGT